MTIILAGVALIFCAFALFTVLSTLIGQSQLMLTFPLAQLIPFRCVLAVVFIILGVLYLIPAFRAHNIIRRIIAAITAVVLLGVGILHGMTVIARGISVAESLPQTTNAQNQLMPQINLLTYNTKGGATSPADIAKIILENQVNVAVLPETSTKQGKQILGRLAVAGKQFQIFDTHTSQWEPDFFSTIILVSNDLGKYRQLDLSDLNKPKANETYTDKLQNFISNSANGSSKFSVVGVAPANANSKLPHVYGVHPIAPLPALMLRWKEEISKAYGICERKNSFILAGDFNSTADHQMALGANCHDAAQEAGIAGIGTWPAKFPFWLRAPIDRVFSGGNNYRGTHAKIVQRGESDHVGIVIHLQVQEVAKQN